MCLGTSPLHLLPAWVSNHLHLLCPLLRAHALPCKLITPQPLLLSYYQAQFLC